MEERGRDGRERMERQGEGEGSSQCMLSKCFSVSHNKILVYTHTNLVNSWLPVSTLT